jgi:hypothetical protein
LNLNFLDRLLVLLSQKAADRIGLA